MIGFGQQTYVPDSNFEAYLELNNMGNGIFNDDSVTTININQVTNLDVSFQNIYDLTGIEDFTALISLHCYNNNLSFLDVSNNTALNDLDCHYNQLTTLDVSNALTDLDCSSNQITTLDVSNNTALTDLDCRGNQLTLLDVSNNTALYDLDCRGNQLTLLDVSNNTALTYLNCYSNQITSLDVSNNTALSDLYCSSNQITSLDVSNNTALNNLYCGNNLLEQLNTKNGNWWFMDVGATENILTCVEVDDIFYATNYWFFDWFTTIATNCNDTVSSIQEHTTNKELLKVTDLLGRETKQTNQPLFYIYDDGTVEKRIVIE